MRHIDYETVLKVYRYGFLFVALHAIGQLVFSAFGIIDPFAGQFIGPLVRPHSYTYEPSYYALYLAPWVMFLTSKAIFANTKRISLRDVRELLWIHCAYLVSTSTSAFISYFIAFPTFLCIKVFILGKHYGSYVYRKARWVFLGLIAALATAFAVVPSIFQQYFFKFFNVNFAKHGSFSTRWKGIERAWSTFIEYPFFGRGIGGVGAHHYHLINNTEAQTPLTLQEVELFDPQNVITEVMSSLGLYGFIGVMCIVVIMAVDLWRIVRLEQISEKEKLISIALTTSWVMQMLILQFSPGLFRNYIWIHTGIVMGFNHMLIARTADNTSQAPDVRYQPSQLSMDT